MSFCHSHCHPQYSTVPSSTLIILPLSPVQWALYCTFASIEFSPFMLDRFQSGGAVFSAPFDRVMGHVPTAEARHKVVLFRYN